MERVSPDARKASGTPGVKPRQAEEIDAIAIGHAARMLRLSGAVERRRVEPAKVRAKANAPEDGADAGAFKRERTAPPGPIRGLLDLPEEALQRRVGRVGGLLLHPVPDARHDHRAAEVGACRSRDLVKVESGYEPPHGVAFARDEE
jgi:hypothetical protein